MLQRHYRWVHEIVNRVSKQGTDENLRIKIQRGAHIRQTIFLQVDFWDD
jgi:hypothetical protein